MNLKRTACLIGLITAWIIPGVWAAEIGDPAPELQVASWIKGGPVALSADKGKIHVIEFWATWCGPCLQSIPHLTELQKQYKDKGVVIVGITDESAPVAKPFVDKMGDKMGYAVAVDKREATHRAYMGAFGVEGIPYAFVVDKTGAITWHGHPMGGLDRVLERMVAGKFDVKLAKEEAAAVKTANQYFQLVEQWNATRDEAQRAQLGDKAKATGQKVLEQGAHSADLLNEFASTIVLMPDTDYRDLDLAAQASEAAFKASEQKPADKARKLIQDYFRTLAAKDQAGSDKKKQLDQISSQILAIPDPEQLKIFAWTILVAKDRDLPLAVRSAEAAVNASKGQDPTALDTYARALFETGQRDKAIEYGKKAMEVNKDEQLEPVLKASLERYEKGSTTQPAGQGSPS